MQLEYFNPEEEVRPPKVKPYRISVSAKQSTITLSPETLRRLNLKEGDFINFAEDKDRPGDWYMALHIPNTLKLFALKAFQRADLPSVKVKNKRLVKQILESIGFEGKGVCIPLGDLTMAGTQAVVPLITRQTYLSKTIKKSCTPASESTN